MKTYGRTTILVNYTEEKLSKANDENKKIIIQDIIKNYYKIYHPNNKKQSEYLQNYKKGIQDVLYKEKHTREEINNKKVENWVLANIEFKKALLLGKPIKYVNANDEASDEISQLNDYVKYEYKSSRDSEIYEDILTVGRGYRYNNKDKKIDTDEAPFELINCDVLNTEVIYSSALGNKQLLTIIETPMIHTNKNNETINYSKFDIYTKNEHFTVTDKEDVYSFSNPTPLLYEEHIITEWYVNKDRISLIEIGKDLYDSINLIQSLDLDDMEQFVNAIMVFTNAEVNEKELDEIKELGAVSITSTENKKASIDLLQSRLNSQQTESFYARLVNSLHQIVGVPIASSSGGMQMGDTGKANFTGQGFTSASIRIQNDENMIAMCDMKSLRAIIKICKESPESKIKSLRMIDIDNKLQIDNRENLLVKSQALQTLRSAGVPDEFAVPAINLFPDPNAVVIAMKKRLEEQLENMKQKQNGNSINEINEVNNDVQDVIEIDNQEQ